MRLKLVPVRQQRAHVIKLPIHPTLDGFRSFSANAVFVLWIQLYYYTWSDRRHGTCLQEKLRNLQVNTDIFVPARTIERSILSTTRACFLRPTMYFLELSYTTTTDNRFLKSHYNTHIITIWNTFFGSLYDCVIYARKNNYNVVHTCGGLSGYTFNHCDDGWLGESVAFTVTFGEHASP